MKSKDDKPLLPKKYYLPLGFSFHFFKSSKRKFTILGNSKLYMCLITPNRLSIYFCLLLLYSYCRLGNYEISEEKFLKNIEEQSVRIMKKVMLLFPNLFFNTKMFNMQFNYLSTSRVTLVYEQIDI